MPLRTERVLAVLADTLSQRAAEDDTPALYYLCFDTAGHLLLHQIDVPAELWRQFPSAAVPVLLAHVLGVVPPDTAQAVALRFDAQLLGTLDPTARVLQQDEAQRSKARSIVAVGLDGDVFMVTATAQSDGSTEEPHALHLEAGAGQATNALIEGLGHFLSHSI